MGVGQAMEIMGIVLQHAMVAPKPEVEPARIPRLHMVALTVLDLPHSTRPVIRILVVSCYFYKNAYSWILILVKLCRGKYDFLLLYTALVGWEKKALTHCAQDDYGSYTHVEAATYACTRDSDCAAIYDDYCDNQGFSLCPLGYTEKSSSSSCLYIKPGTVKIIKMNILQRLCNI